MLREYASYILIIVTAFCSVQRTNAVKKKTSDRNGIYSSTPRETESYSNYRPQTLETLLYIIAGGATVPRPHSMRGEGDGCARVWPATSASVAGHTPTQPVAAVTLDHVALEHMTSHRHRTTLALQLEPS